MNQQTIGFVILNALIVFLFLALTLWAYKINPFHENSNCREYFSRLPEWAGCFFKIFGPIVVLAKLLEIFVELH